MAEHSLFSLASGAQRARLSPLSRWQHLLLHWTLFRQSSPSSCRVASQPAAPSPRPSLHPAPHPPTADRDPLVGVCVKESDPWVWPPACPAPAPAPTHVRSGPLVPEKQPWAGGQDAWALVPAALPTPWVALGKSLPHPMPQCSHGICTCGPQTGSPNCPGSHSLEEPGNVEDHLPQLTFIYNLK